MPKCPLRALVIIAIIGVAVGLITTFSGPRQSSPSALALAERVSPLDEAGPATGLSNDAQKDSNTTGYGSVGLDPTLEGSAGLSTTGCGRLSTERQKSTTASTQGRAARTDEMPRSAAKPASDGDAWTYPGTLRNLAVTNYLRAMEKLGQAESDLERYLVLGDTAKGALNFGKIEDARKYAIELLALDEKLKEQRSRNGNAVHDANLVLGRIAVMEGDIETAKQHLAQAGTTTGSPVLDTFGPNMSLANDLLQRGEREAVLEYFEQCRRFWKPVDAGLLDRWTEEVKAGRVPNFKANLYY